MYSNGLSEIILGKAIKQLQLPRHEIVVMTKVFYHLLHNRIIAIIYLCMQLFFTVAQEHGNNLFVSGQKPDEIGYVNQHGLSRKVWLHSVAVRKSYFFFFSISLNP